MARACSTSHIQKADLLSWTRSLATFPLSSNLSQHPMILIGTILSKAPALFVSLGIFY